MTDSVTPDTSPPSEQPSTDTNLAYPAGQSAKIMIVDDEEYNIMLVQTYLEDVGYHHFVPCVDATRVWEQIQETRPDLILLDIMMPKVNGLEILEKLRRDEEFRHLPVLILTASKEDELEEWALDSGATEFLSAPVQREELALRVHHALKNSGCTSPSREQQNKDTDSTSPRGKSAKIMIVDDEEYNVMLFQTYLRDAGFHDFVPCLDANRALERIQETQPELILLDIMMPKTNGLVILEQLRQDEELRHIPVLVVTASRETIVKQWALELGVSGFLSTPVPRDELAMRVYDALRDNANA